MSLLNDSRFGQISALVDDARTLLHEIQEEGHSPVDTRQLQKIRENLNHALAGVEYFTRSSKTRWS